MKTSFHSSLWDQYLLSVGNNWCPFDFWPTWKDYIFYLIIKFFYIVKSELKVLLVSCQFLLPSFRHYLTKLYLTSVIYPHTWWLARWKLLRNIKILFHQAKVSCWLVLSFRKPHKLVIKNKIKLRVLVRS